MRFGWQPYEESVDGNPARVIALTRGMASVTLEPAGQLELSGAPLETIHDTCKEVGGHLREVREVADELRLGFLGMGFQPKWRRDQMPWMPKGRYRIMRDYMPGRHARPGHDDPHLHRAGQCLDYASEADMAKKFRVSLRCSRSRPRCSPTRRSPTASPTATLSYRSHIWTDTDRDRTGMLDFVFEDGFGYERYVDYLLDVPMYFSHRDGRYIDASGKSFRKFLRGELDVLPGALPTLRDWNDHMTTAFPEVRLKKFLEMRGADSGPWSCICALPAFWVGLL